jgi:WD40 repeat protein
VRLWDVIAAKERVSLREHRLPVVAVAFATDGTLLASCGATGELKVHDVVSSKQKLALEGPAGPVASIHFLRDNSRLAVCGRDGTLRLWDVEGRFEAVVRWDRWNYRPPGVSFIPGSSFVRFGHDPEARAGAVAVSPEGLVAVSRTLAVTTKALQWQTFATAWDMRKRTGVRMGGVDTGPVLAVARGEANGILHHLAIVSARPGRPEQAHEVTIWRAVTRTLAHTLKGHTGRVYCLAFNADGTLLASGSADGTVRLWDPWLGKKRVVLNGHAGAITAVAFSPDGKTLASGDHAGAVKLWDVSTGKEGRTLAGHKGAVLALAFSRDGGSLAAGGGGRVVRIWDLARGGGRDSAEHRSAVLALAFSPDGRAVASGCVDGSARVWRPASGEPLRTLPSDGVLPRSQQSRGAVRAVSFSPDGKRLALGTEGGWVGVWGLDTGQAITLSRDHGVAVRLLTYDAAQEALSGLCVLPAGDRDVPVSELSYWDITQVSPQVTLR